LNIIDVLVELAHSSALFFQLYLALLILPLQEGNSILVAAYLILLDVHIPKTIDKHLSLSHLSLSICFPHLQA
jgi:hypothetical protein